MSEYAWSVAIPMGALVLALIGILLHAWLQGAKRRKAARARAVAASALVAAGFDSASVADACADREWERERGRRAAALRQHATRLRAEAAEWHALAERNPGGPVLPPQPTALYPGEKLIRFDTEDPK